MPLINKFDPPASIGDLDAIPNGRKAWSETASFWTDEVISTRVD